MESQNSETASIAIGQQVIRVNYSWLPDQRGEVIDQTETRIRVMWKRDDGSNDKRTWAAKSAEGKRWARVYGGHLAETAAGPVSS